MRVSSTNIENDPYLLQPFACSTDFVETVVQSERFSTIKPGSFSTFENAGTKSEI